MTVYYGGKKGEMAIGLIGLVGKSVNSESENRIGGRKWEDFVSYRFASYQVPVCLFKNFN
ncbi:hypothetical protein A4D02_19525 [Niastella koreensis]|uniref:Uncharacterized protein n=1 Tax=Niastella koreensis TaxID=354356 RepID=A0ABX3P2K1_9BACT|nr:hypothetical protein A4D02_19525 [Niastella koreensis]